jgi:CHAT domain-containing protein
MQQVLNLFATGLWAARLGFAGRYRGDAPEEARTLTPEEKAAARQTALAAFAQLADEMGRAFVQPWAARLEELQPSELILVPSAFLHLLPLHAAVLDGKPLMHHYPLAYLPNAALARSLVRRRKRDPRPEGRLVMGPPVLDPLDPLYLPAAALETGYLAKKWGLKGQGQPYLSKDMRKAVLYNHAGRVHRAHLATHSAFDFEDYLRSHILFHEERLTLFELIGDVQLDFRGMRLFYLSSCEGALARADAGDELQGLVWAITYAGARAVMASLWPVHDGAARAMALRFYRHWQPGVAMAEAYGRAMADLREEPQFANPYFWAPFALFGDVFVKE